MDNIMVSICSITFNHAAYIRECLDGFLMQKCDFDFEILIHDDASTDGTSDIIKEYQEKYPHIIKPIIQTENKWSKGVRTIQSTYNFSRAKGKYIAMCEGDDYWTDPLKLQKQVEFLESNSGYSMCFTNAKVLLEGNIGKSYKNLYSHLTSGEYSGTDILKKWTIPTASVVYRRIENIEFPIDDRFIFGDIVLFLTLARYGKLYCINEKTVVYRRNIGGITFSGKFNYTRKINHYLAIKNHFGEKYNRTVNTLIAKVYSGAFISGKLREESFKVLKDLFRNPKYIPLFLYSLLYTLFNIFYNRIKD